MSSDSTSRLLKPRPILPAPSAAPSGSGGAGPGSTPPSLNPRRPQIAAACEACRKRKSRCTGDRPKCSACVTRQTSCNYNTNANETQSRAIKRKYEEHKSNNSAYDRMFEVLRSRSESDATAILQRIRSGHGIEDVLRQVESGDLLLQVALVPETKYRYVFPLSSDMPSNLLRPLNPYLDSLVYSWTCSQATERDAPRFASSVGQTGGGESAEIYAPYLSPYHAASVADALLSVAEPSKWTTVCTDDVLMRRLLGAFFLQDHDWCTLLQKDYFLEDMIKERHQFCSSLLVNAMLALSCMYCRDLVGRAELWDPNTLGYLFNEEAKRLWASEHDKNKLTTIHAALMLLITHNSCGADKIGWFYLTQAVTLGYNIGLFEPSAAAASAQLRKARDYTAWGLFFWQSFLCFQYFRPPLVDQPPSVAPPEPSEDPKWYGELWLKYPLSKSLHPSNSGDVFKAKAEFSIILNDAVQRLFGVGSEEQTVSAADIAHFYRRFRNWYDGLPESLSPRRIVLPAHLKLHMHYFEVLLRLLQTPTLTNAEGSGQDKSMTDLFGQPIQSLISHLKACLETLLRVYYLRHGFEWMDIWLVVFLQVIYSSAMDDIMKTDDLEKLSSLRSTVILLSKGIYEQGQSFFVAQLMFELVRGKMRPQDMKTLARYIKLTPMRETQLSALKQVQMEWPVEIVSIADNPGSKGLGLLVKQFSRASMEPMDGEDPE